MHRCLLQAIPASSGSPGYRTRRPRPPELLLGGVKCVLGALGEGLALRRRRWEECISEGSRGKGWGGGQHKDGNPRRALLTLSPEALITNEER